MESIFFLKQGMLQNLNNHVKLECFFSSTNPNAPKKKPKNGDKIVWHPMVDEEVQEKINQNTVQGSLEARILSKVDSIK